MVQTVDSPVVLTEQGLVLGRISTDFFNGTYYSFQGIPYAAPPLGPLRFKSPEPPQSWEGLRDARNPGNICFSHHLMTRNITGSEDCLFLNVYTPSLPKPSHFRHTVIKLLSVLVWVHGGGFTVGSGSPDIHGPDYLVSEEVVVVTLNYRLGILGFLALENETLEVPGNTALRDVIAALKWVKSNIRSFGGNPHDITLFGESSGGIIAHHLMFSTLANGLFHKVIAQSGAAFNVWSYGDRFAGVLADKLNISKYNESELLETLRNTPVEDILKIQDTMTEPMVADRPRPFGPIIESPNSKIKAVIETDPLEILLSGKYPKIPLLIGYNSKEGISFDTKARRLNVDRFEKDFEKLLPFDLHLSKGSPKSLEVAKEIKDFYFQGKEPSKETIENDYMMRSDIFYVKGVYKAAVSHKGPCYFYRMSLVTQLNYFKRVANTTTSGMCHGDDIFYLWKNEYLDPVQRGSIEEKSIRRITKHWANFAKSGNPNFGEEDCDLETPDIWKPILGNEINFADIGDDLVPGNDPDHDRMQFWDRIYSQK